MAVNEARSMNADLKLGAGDGKYKSLTPGRGGEVEMSNVVTRMTELQEQYNIQNRLSPMGEAHL
jgi:hypothetical protein